MGTILRGCHQLKTHELGAGKGKGISATSGRVTTRNARVGFCSQRLGTCVITHWLAKHWIFKTLDFRLRFRSRFLDSFWSAKSSRGTIFGTSRRAHFGGHGNVELCAQMLTETFQFPRVLCAPILVTKFVSRFGLFCGLKK